MEHNKRFKVAWTVWMAGGGITVAAIVYLATGSVWWTIFGLLASSVVLNMIGPAVTQPINAVRNAGGRAPKAKRPR